MELVKSNNYQKFCAKSQDRIIIDCGHTPITIDNEYLVFGKECNAPSSTEIKTVQIALEISENLLSQGKKVILNFCFSDVGYNINPEIRKKLKTFLNNENILNILPTEYKIILKEIMGKVAIHFNLQSANSNIASAAIKKVKKQLRSLTEQQMFGKYSCYFLLKDECTFGILSPIMFNNTFGIEEHDLNMLNQLLCSNMGFTERDIQRFPLLNLKKSGFIGLYDKFDGILCPATYMGNLFNISDCPSVISIYSRADDNNIGEKILAGAIAFQHLSEGSQLFLSIVGQKASTNNEVFFLEKDFIASDHASLSENVSDFLSAKSNFRVYA